ncbi:hypothetical protein [Evtepia sp.]|uniref:hypothetical protein n=1 Tax=Evtepia sp. TaxID=2773933 RepID=UPI003F188C67
MEASPEREGEGASPLAELVRSHFRAAREDRADPSPLSDDLRDRRSACNQGGTAK